jgi:hypothetical protein
VRLTSGRRPRAASASASVRWNGWSAGCFGERALERLARRQVAPLEHRGAGGVEQRVHRVARAARAHERRAQQAVRMAPAGERRGGQPLVVRDTLEREQAEQPLAAPDQRDAQVLPGAERLEGRQQHPGLVERVGLERLARKLLPGRNETFQLDGAARERVHGGCG